MNFREFDWIASLSSATAEGLILGIGDDGALFEGRGPWCISTDSLQEGVHFLRDDDPFSVGWKTVAVGVSDMAAMGCRPRFFLLNLHMTAAYAKSLPFFRDGLQSALSRYKVSLIGGDTIFAETGPFSVAGVILGTPFAGKPVLRSGARPGDLICVTGPGLGGSFPRRHLNFEPRLEWGELLCKRSMPSAMMDISDGLLQDLGHILDRSGVSAELDLWKVPVSKDLSGPPEERLRRALGDGEDFELLFTLSEADFLRIPKDIPVSAIGRIREGKGEIMARESADCPFKPFPRLGYSHGGGCREIGARTTRSRPLLPLLSGL